MSYANELTEEEVDERRKAWDELDVTRDEVSDLLNNLKSPKFREMLCDYAKEVTDPANRRIFETEFAQLERERGAQVTFVHPKPGYVIKSSLDGRIKCFINISQDKIVDKPICRPTQFNNNNNKQRGPGVDWSLPHLMIPPRDELDSDKNRCRVFDVVFHPDAIYLSEKYDKVKGLLNATAIQSIERDFKVKLDQKNLKFPKLKFFGVSQPTVVRKPCAIPEQKSDADEEIYQKLIARYEEVRKEKLKKKEEKPKRASPTVKYFNAKDNKANQSDTAYAKPRFSIKHQSYIDMKEFQESKHAKMNATVPKNLVITINLPLLKSSNDATLDVQERCLTLKSETPAKYHLKLPLSYRVDPDLGNAKFDAKSKKLIVTLPVIPPEVSISSDGKDSGVKSDHGSPVPESQVSNDEAKDQSQQSELPSEAQSYCLDSSNEPVCNVSNNKDLLEKLPVRENSKDKDSNKLMIQANNAEDHMACDLSTVSLSSKGTNYCDDSVNELVCNDKKSLHQSDEVADRDLVYDISKETISKEVTNTDADEAYEEPGHEDLNESSQQSNIDTCELQSPTQSYCPDSTNEPVCNNLKDKDSHNELHKNSKDKDSNKLMHQANNAEDHMACNLSNENLSSKGTNYCDDSLNELVCNDIKSLHQSYEVVDRDVACDLSRETISKEVTNTDADEAYKESVHEDLNESSQQSNIDTYELQSYCPDSTNEPVCNNSNDKDSHKELHKNSKDEESNKLVHQANNSEDQMACNLSNENLSSKGTNYCDDSLNELVCNDKKSLYQSNEAVDRDVACDLSSEIISDEMKNADADKTHEKPLCKDVNLQLYELPNGNNSNEVESDFDDTALRTSNVEFLFMNPNVRYIHPTFICNFFENVLAVTVHVKNVDKECVYDRILDNNAGFHILFTSIGAGYFPIYYSLCLKLGSDAIVPESLTIDRWDNNVVISIMMKHDEIPEQCFAGIDEDNLEIKDLTVAASIKNKLRALEMQVDTENEVCKDVEVIRNDDSTIVKVKSANKTVDTQSSYTDDDDNDDENDGNEREHDRKSTSQRGECVHKFEQKSRIISESSGDELPSRIGSGNDSIRYKGILKRRNFSRSVSESSIDDYGAVTSSSVTFTDSVNEFTSESEGSSLKKTVRFNDVVHQKLYRSNSSILGQRKKNQRKLRNKKRALERRLSESENSETEERDKYKVEVKNIPDSDTSDAVRSILHHQITDQNNSINYSNNVTFDSAVTETIPKTAGIKIKRRNISDKRKQKSISKINNSNNHVVKTKTESHSDKESFTEIKNDLMFDFEV